MQQLHEQAPKEAVTTAAGSGVSKQEIIYCDASVATMTLVDDVEASRQSISVQTTPPETILVPTHTDSDAYNTVATPARSFSPEPKSGPMDTDLEAYLTAVESQFESDLETVRSINIRSELRASTIHTPASVNVHRPKRRQRAIRAPSVSSTSSSMTATSLSAVSSATSDDDEEHVQCSGITNRNRRCLIWVYEGKTACHQHRSEAPGSLTTQLADNSVRNRCRGVTNLRNRCKKLAPRDGANCELHVDHVPQSVDRGRCQALTSKDLACKNRAKYHGRYCHSHKFYDSRHLPIMSTAPF